MRRGSSCAGLTCRAAFSWRWLCAFASPVGLLGVVRQCGDDWWMPLRLTFDTGVVQIGDRRERLSCSSSSTSALCTRFVHPRPAPLYTKKGKGKKTQRVSQAYNHKPVLQLFPSHIMLCLTKLTDRSGEFVGDGELEWEDGLLDGDGLELICAATDSGSTPAGSNTGASTTTTEGTTRKSARQKEKNII